MLLALAIPVILLAASLGGALRFRDCWRGLAIDKHPVCRRCRYDLIGIPKPYTACPECGADLTARKATAVGNRKRKTGHALVAGFISLASTALLAAILFNAAIRINFNPHKPFWLLQLEATTPSLNSNGHELDELLTRTKKGSLSAVQLDSLMGSVLQEQANTRPSIPIGYDVHVSARRTANRGQGDKTHFYYAEYGDLIEIDGLTLDRTHHRRSGGGFAGSGGSTGGGTGFHTNKPPFDQLQPGQYIITYIQPTEIRLGSVSGPLIASFDRTANCPIEFLPADADKIELFNDPAAAISVEAGVSIKNNRIELRPMRNRPDILNASIYFNMDGTTAPFGYKVITMQDGQEYVLARIAESGPTHNTSHGFQVTWPAELDTDRIDLLFRLDPAAARGTTDVYRILDHEFTIKDVEVVRQP